MALPDIKTDFPAWYQEVVKQADLAEVSLAPGCMVIKPYGYAIWETIQREVDARIKATGHENVYFPLLIPSRLLEKEAEHVEGFAPELAIVTHGGGSELEEPLVVRPTSETIMWATYAKWVQSYRDLPLLYNQWANVVRWELRPRLFLRTREFLWQEGHTAHETHEEAMAETLTILNEVYVDTVEKVLAMPALKGRKSASERFAGALETFTFEPMMRDRKALQAGTSHYLGQNFAKAYDVKFLGRDGQQDYAYATSWGVSTRLIGGVIMCHGDERGLRLPPALAPHQVVIVPIYKTDDERARVLEAADRVKASLPGTRVKVDDRDNHRPGYKFNEWEVKGVPVRIDIGPRDLDAGHVTVVSRITGAKETVGLDALSGLVPSLLDEIQFALYDDALTFRDAHTFRPDSYDEMQQFLKEPGGFMHAAWCGRERCEQQVKTDTKATIRCLPMEPIDPGRACIVCGEPGVDEAVWALSY